VPFRAPALLAGKRRYPAVRTRAARQAFNTAERTPKWLDLSLLDRLQER
jgi:hypothetical protein